MAGSMSTYLEQKLLKHSLGVEAYTMPSPLYMSLHTGNPGEGNNHPTGGAELADGVGSVSYTHLTLPTTPYV